MRYGFSDPEWTEFLNRLPNKSLDLIKEYAALFLSHIIEEEEGASAGQDTFKDGVPKEGLRVLDVLTRLAVVQLIEDKVSGNKVVYLRILKLFEKKRGSGYSRL